MNSLKQLLRQPIRSVMGIITLMLSGTILCLSISLYYSAAMTVKEAASVYITIALPTDRTETIEKVVGEEVWISERSVLTEEMHEWINSLADSYPEVVGAYQQKFISAYSQGLNTLVSAKEEGAYSYSKDAPYTNAAFVITIESMDNDTAACMVDITAKIDEALLLHDGYKLPDGLLHFTYQYFSEDEWNATDLEIDGTYIVFGKNYVDNGLALKKSLTEILKVSEDEIDWNNINYDITEYVNSLKEHDIDVNNTVALYEYNGEGMPLTASQIEAITSASMFVQNPAHFVMGGYTGTYPDGTVETVAATEEEIKAATHPTITRLTTDLDTFLGSEEGSLWRETLEQYRITNHSVPVLGTDLLESIFQFHQHNAVIKTGRSFTKEEYKSGSSVCIISEELALENNLQVGDTIPLAFYQGYNFYLEKSNSIPADPYSQVAGFSTKEESFQIIGIYRQSNLWADTSYSFTPNSIFIPNSALTCEAYTDNTGIFYTIVLKNGSIDKMKSYEKALGYKDILYYYDQGYSGIHDTLADFLSTARILLIIGVITWVAMLLLFLTLYTARQKKTVGMMLSLGSGKRKTMLHILCSTLTLVLIAAVISGILGWSLLGSVIDQVYSYTSEQVVTNRAFSASVASDAAPVKSLTVQNLPQISAVVAAVQFVIFALITWLYGHILLKKKPLALMKNKEN